MCFIALRIVLVFWFARNSDVLNLIRREIVTKRQRVHEHDIASNAHFLIP
jgi:hypothetical protein